MDNGAVVGRSVQRLGSPHLVRESDVDRALTVLAAGPGGLVITGDAGLGKSALARRVLERLHGDGWAVAALTGRWYPMELFDSVAEALETCRADFTQRQDALEILRDRSSYQLRFEVLRDLLERAPFALLFDDLGRNVGPEGYLDPGFAEAFDRLCNSASQGRVLVTSRETPPPLSGVDRLGTLHLDSLDAAGGAELAAALPNLSTMDSSIREQVVAAVAAHPRSLQLVDAWLGATGKDSAERLLAEEGPALPELVLAELTAGQREMLLQAAIATFPLTARDLAAACDADNPDIEQAQRTAARLTELGLLHAWPDDDGDTVVLADRWIAEELAPHQGEGLADRHERAVSMHYAETRSERRTFDDFVAVTRHLVQVDGMGDLTHFALDLTKRMDRTDYAGMALLGEVAPTVPAGNGHYLPLRERQIITLIQCHFMTAAREAGERTLRAVAEWAATHPQRDEARFCLGAAQNVYGVALLHGGDLLAAEPIFAATVDIYHELGAEHPTSVEAQRRLGYALEHLGDVYRGLNRPEDEDKLYKTYAECVFVRTQLFEADPSPDAALAASPSFQHLADLADQNGDRDNARSLLNSRLMMVEAMATAYPDDEELTQELATAREALATVGGAP